MNARNPATRRGPLHGDTVENLARFRKPLLEYLISSLGHPDRQVSCLAANMLGALGDPAALGALKPLMVSDNPALRESALRSVERLLNSRVEVLHCRTAGCDTCLIRSIAEEALARTSVENSCTPAV